MPLEHHDELGLPWDAWADGRVHRLVKGRDFLQSAEVVQEAAENAARRLDKVARVVPEPRFGRVYLWVQFADCQITLGEPCRCGSHELRRVSTQYADCAACGATVVVREPRERRRGAAGISPDGDEALIATLLATQPQRAKARAGTRNPASDLTRLGAFSSVVLFSAERDDTRERLYGQALAAGGRCCLLVVDVARRDNRRVEDPAYPGGVVHVVRSVPVDPFGAAIRLDRFPQRTPDLAIDDPLAGMSRDDPGDYGDEFPWLDPPPARLDAFAGVALTPRRGGGAPGDRLYGYGRGPDGDTVLLTVRYRGRNGQRVPDPERPGQDLHAVRWIPLAPFGPVVDLDALLAEAGRT